MMTIFGKSSDVTYRVTSRGTKVGKKFFFAVMTALKIKREWEHGREVMYIGHCAHPIWFAVLQVRNIQVRFTRDYWNNKLENRSKKLANTNFSPRMGKRITRAVARLRAMPISYTNPRGWGGRDLIHVINLYNGSE